MPLSPTEIENVYLLIWFYCFSQSRFVFSKFFYIKYILFIFSSPPTYPKSYAPNFILCLSLSLSLPLSLSFSISQTTTTVNTTSHKLIFKNQPDKGATKKCRTKQKAWEKLGVCFALTNSCTWELSWSVINTFINSLLEKTDLPITSNYQLQITSWLGWDSRDTFPSQDWYSI